MTDDVSIRHRIGALVGEEKALREQVGEHAATPDAGERLRELETELDQCWDLLRQRDALRTAGRSPEDAAVRPAAVVEHYLE